jgi:hypothetical protein
MERIRCKKNVLPEPYSPITKRTAEPPSLKRSMSCTSASTSRRRPTWMCCCPARGTTPRAAIAAARHALWAECEPGTLLAAVSRVALVIVMVRAVPPQWLG